MQREVVRIVPLRTANVVALVYALLLVVFSLVFLPIAAIVPMKDQAGNPVSRTPLLVLISLYPLLGAIGSWIGTILVSHIYNFLAPRVGGVRVEVSDPARAAVGAGAA
jgi:hypothetical protein